MTTRAETNAFVGLIREHPQLVTVTFVTIAKHPPPREAEKVLPPYVLVHPSGGPDERERFTGPQVHRRPSFGVHCVGYTADQALLLADFVDGQLRPNGRGRKPVVPSRRTGRIVRDGNFGVLIDDDVTPPLVYAALEYAFKSNP